MTQIEKGQNISRLQVSDVRDGEVYVVTFKQLKKHSFRHMKAEVKNFDTWEIVEMSPSSGWLADAA